MGAKTRNYGDTYFYSKGKYEEAVYKFIMSAERVDKNDKSFEDIRYEVKRRQIYKSIVNVLDNQNILLLYNENGPLPRSFKIFTCKDPKSGDGKKKVFIDVTGIISQVDGAYTIKSRSVDTFIAYLIAAMIEAIYYTDPNKLVNKNDIIVSGGKCFAKLVFYIIDYLRIGNVEKVREKTLYLASRYYEECLLGKSGETVENRAKNLSGLTKREIDVLNLYIDPDSFKNIDTFICTLSKALKDDRLNTTIFFEKWRWLFGASTAFATELFTVFAKMITDVYAATYINNQKTIENVTKPTYIEFSKALLQIGSELF